MNNYTNPVTVTGNPASFEASGNGKLLSLSVPFSPIQDLHGYSSPWPAGGGKNKFQTTATSQTVSGVSFTVNADGSVLVNGTATADITFPIGYYTLKAGTAIKYTGAPAGSTTSTYWIVYSGYPKSAGYVITADRTTETSDWGPAPFSIMIANGVTISNLTFYPLIVDASVTDYTWTPYSNICPISGRTGVSVYVSPTQDVADATTYAVDWTSEAGTVYGGSLDVVTGVLTVDTANIASYNGETITEPWISSMDAYVAGATPTTGAQVVYTLATPLTYQLTPTQIALILGQNYVWSDSNEAVTLTYVIELFTRYTFIVNGNDYTGLVERDSYRTAVTPVYGETIQTLDGVGHTALLRVKGSLTVKLNPQTAAQTAAICADLLNAPCEVQYKCLQRNVNVTALMVLDVVSAMFLSRCLYLGQKWNDVDEIVLKEL